MFVSVTCGIFVLCHHTVVNLFAGKPELNGSNLPNLIWTVVIFVPVFFVHWPYRMLIIVWNLKFTNSTSDDLHSRQVIVDKRYRCPYIGIVLTNEKGFHILLFEMARSLCQYIDDDISISHRVAHWKRGHIIKPILKTENFLYCWPKFFWNF
jgi:hypothetical protein